MSYDNLVEAHQERGLCKVVSSSSGLVAVHSQILHTNKPALFPSRVRTKESAYSTRQLPVDQHASTADHLMYKSVFILFVPLHAIFCLNMHTKVEQGLLNCCAENRLLPVYTGELMLLEH